MVGEESKMNHSIDKREFKRLPIDLSMEVTAERSDGDLFIDKAVLEDVSGGGAKFITQNPEKYFLGQLLKIAIIMPGTSDISAQMRTDATVVRIDPADKSKNESQNMGITVAVKFNKRLNFERNEV